MFDAILRMMLVFLEYMQKRGIMVMKGKSVQHGFNRDFGSDHVMRKSQLSCVKNFVAVLVILLMSQLTLCLCFLFAL